MRPNRCAYYSLLWQAVAYVRWEKTQYVIFDIAARLLYCAIELVAIEPDVY